MPILHILMESCMLIIIFFCFIVYISFTAAINSGMIQTARPWWLLFPMHLAQGSHLSASLHQNHDVTWYHQGSLLCLRWHFPPWFLFFFFCSNFLLTITDRSTCTYQRNEIYKETAVEDKKKMPQGNGGKGQSSSMGMDYLFNLYDLQSQHIRLVRIQAPWPLWFLHRTPGPPTWLLSSLYPILHFLCCLITMWKPQVGAVRLVGPLCY